MQGPCAPHLKTNSLLLVLAVSKITQDKLLIVRTLHQQRRQHVHIPKSLLSISLASSSSETGVTDQYFPKHLAISNSKQEVSISELATFCFMTKGHQVHSLLISCK